MQYLVSVIDDKTGSATPTEMAAIGAFNDRLEADGHWVFAAGLSSPSTATVIDNLGGEAVFTGDLAAVEHSAADALVVAQTGAGVLPATTGAGGQQDLRVPKTPSISCDLRVLGYAPTPRQCLRHGGRGKLDHTAFVIFL